jgi:hypothetical protein
MSDKSSSEPSEPVLSRKPGLPAIPGRDLDKRARASTVLAAGKPVPDLESRPPLFTVRVFTASGKRLVTKHEALDGTIALELAGAYGGLGYSQDQVEVTADLGHREPK